MKSVALAIVSPKHGFLCLFLTFVIVSPQQVTAKNYRGLPEQTQVKVFNQQLNAGIEIESASLGFSSDLMHSVIMAPSGQGGFTALFSLHDLIAALVSAHTLIHPVDGLNGRLQGFSMQRPGLILTNVLFRREGSQLFLEAGGEETTKRKLSVSERAFMLLKIQILYLEATKQALTLYPPMK